MYKPPHDLNQGALNSLTVDMATAFQDVMKTLLEDQGAATPLSRHASLGSRMQPLAIISLRVEWHVGSQGLCLPPGFVDSLVLTLYTK